MKPNEIAELLAENVKRLMDAREPAWTQVELAKQMDTSQGNISRLLGGTHAPSAATLSKLTEAFGIALCDLLCPSKPKKK